ncbi:hypothetical protein ABT086_33930 [Streptomyces mirabilis]
MGGGVVAAGAAGEGERAVVRGLRRPVRGGEGAHIGAVRLLDAPGQLIVLEGASAADVRAAEGVVRVHGRPAPEWSAPELALRRAVLPQSATLSFPFTVEEVVRMGRAPWAGTSREDDDVAVAEAMAATEVDEFAPRPFSALSGCAGQGREVFTGALLSEVYRQPVEVVPHPRTGAVLVTPERGAVTAERDT